MVLHACNMHWCWQHGLAGGCVTTKRAGNAKAMAGISKPGRLAQWSALAHLVMACCAAMLLDLYTDAN
jgi:hypothetical protein